MNNIVFYDVRENPFSIYGIMANGAVLKRMNSSAAKNVSETVYKQHTNTTGGRIRFSTNSPVIALKAEYANVGKLRSMSMIATAGFDMYIKNEANGKYEFSRSFEPDLDVTESFTAQHGDLGNDMKNVMIHFPLFSDVYNVYIGICEDAEIGAGEKYSDEKPIVFYGSSITHGVGASRPGNTYPAIISRALDCNFINLGFASACKAEMEMCDYISGIDMGVFMYDYDYNADSVEYLQSTHEKFFREFRRRDPQVPIVMTSRPSFDYLPERSRKMRSVIHKTYETAMKNGDQNVYFIDGEEFFGKEDRDACTVDAVHPTDIGYLRIAKKYIDVIGKIINIK